MAKQNFKIKFSDQEYPESNRSYVADEKLLEKTFGKDMSIAIINFSQLSDFNFSMKIVSDLQEWSIERIE